MGAKYCDQYVCVFNVYMYVIIPVKFGYLVFEICLHTDSIDAFGWATESASGL